MSERDSQRAPGSASSASSFASESGLDAVEPDRDDVVIQLGPDAATTVDLAGDQLPGRGSLPPTPVVDGLARRRLFDLDFVDAPSLDPVVEALLARHAPSGSHRVNTVLTPNVDIMVQLDEDRSRSGTVWEMFRTSQFCLPDGQPIVLASRLLGRPLGARLTGSGLFGVLWPRLVADKRTVFVVASSDELAKRLKAEYPEVTVTVPPIFPAEDTAAIEQLAKTIIASAAVESPEFVFLGIGNPKDALVADVVLRQWPDDYGRVPTLLALGGSASMYVGITKRAPEWVQRIGMEWFYRFVQEPRRLFHRYFVRDTAFIGLVRREWLAQRRATGLKLEG